MAAPRPTIAIIVNRGWVAWKFREGLIRHLQRSGYRVIVLAQRDEWFKELERISDEVVDVPMAQSTVDWIAEVKTLFSYRRELLRIRPMAALTFTIKPNLYASLMCRWLDIPVIANVTGLGSAAKRRGIGSWLLRRLYGEAFRRARKVFCQNPDDMRNLVGKGLLKSGKATLLPGSGVDTSRYFPVTERRSTASSITFCMLARLLRDKGVVEFALAAERVKRELPQVRFQLWGILDSADPRCVSLEEIDDWVRQDVLEFNGEARDARAAFAQADVVVLPSYYPEGVPRTLLEAASMEIPGITTDMPGCRVAVVDGDTGFLCAPRSVDALVDAMLRIAGLSASERLAMGRRARQRMIEEFDESIVLDAYMREIQHVQGDAVLQDSSLSRTGTTSEG